MGLGSRARALGLDDLRHGWGPWNAVPESGGRVGATTYVEHGQGVAALEPAGSLIERQKSTLCEVSEPTHPDGCAGFRRLVGSGERPWRVGPKSRPLN